MEVASVRMLRSTERLLIAIPDYERGTPYMAPVPAGHSVPKRSRSRPRTSDGFGPT